MNVMFVVTHLLGTGHLTRATTLGEAFAAEGHLVTVVSGGLPVPHFEANGIEFRQLPPLRSDGANFGRLLDSDGRLVSTDYRTARRDQLKAHLIDVAPDVVITELFPFGRRMLRDEFLTMLTSANQLKRRPLVCASIRDILDPPSKPSRTEETNRIIEQFYDAVLVHSDPEIIAIDKSWPVTPQLLEKLHYTGFVSRRPAQPHPNKVGKNEIVVSAGGGNTGQSVFEAALGAARLDPDRTWRLLVGGSNIPERCRLLSRDAPPNAIIEPPRPDFREILHHAHVSVSMCGYNTTLDLLQAGTKAICVPLDAGNEVEQTLRAEALEKLNGFEIIASHDLSPEKLLFMIAKLENSPARKPMLRGQNGAKQSVEIVARLFEARG